MNAVLATLVAVLASSAVSLLVARSSRKSTEAQIRASAASERDSNQTESRRVDGEAYERAQDINRGIVQELSESLDRVREELSAVRVELVAAKTANIDLQAAAEHLTHANVRLLGLLERCKQLLADNHIPAPEGV